MNDITKELIADGHSQFRLSARLRAIANRLNDDQLTRLADQFEGCRVARCAFMLELGALAAEKGLIDADVSAKANEPK